MTFDNRLGEDTLWVGVAPGVTAWRVPEPQTRALVLNLEPLR